MVYMKKKTKRMLMQGAVVLTAIGAINWGSTELGYNLVNMLLGSFPMIESAVYYIVGVSGLYSLYAIFA